MPTDDATTVPIEPKHRKLLRRLVRTGRFASESDALNAAMALLAADERERADEIADLRRGITDFRAGRTRPAADVLAELERKYPEPRSRRARRGA